MEKLKAAMRRDMTLTILIGLTIAVLLFLAIGLGDKIFNGMSFQSMAFQLSEFAMLSLGMGLVMLLGGIDLGIVANANMSAMMGAFILSDIALRESLGDGPVIVIAIVVSLLVATAAGVINGILIAKVSVNPIIATLGTMTLYNGIAMAASGGNGVSGFPQDFTLMGTATMAGIPLLFIVFIVIAVVIIFIMGRTGFGRKIYMIGENHTAARFSAINNEKSIIIIYAMAGFCAGIAGLMIGARVNSVKCGYGDTYLLQAILVAVLAGISPSGGKGKVVGILLALVCIQMLQSSFTIWQFTPYSKKMIWGLMLLLLLFINMLIDYLDVKKQKKLLQMQYEQSKKK